MQAPTQSPTATLPSQPTTPVAVQRVLDDPHHYMWQALMLPTGELMTWWSGNCSRGGRRCHAVYVLRDTEGNRAVFAVPASDGHSLLGATVDGFAVERDVLRHHALHANGGFVVRPDGSRVDWTASHQPVRAAHDLVVLSARAEHARAIDVSTATVGQLPKLPADGYLTIASDGTLWLVSLQHGSWRVWWPRDGGETWASRRLTEYADFRLFGSISVGQEGHVLAQTTQFPATLRAHPEQQLYVTTDNGDSWSRLRGVPFGSSPSFAASPDGRLLAVDAIGRLWRSDSAWSSFRRIRDVPQFAYLAGLGVAGAYVYIVEPGRRGKVFVSDDDGETWDRVPTL